MNSGNGDSHEAGPSTADVSTGSAAGSGGAAEGAVPGSAAATPRGVTSAPSDGDHTNTLAGPEDFPFSY